MIIFYRVNYKKLLQFFESDNNIVHVANPAKQISPDGSYQTEPIPADMMSIPLDGDLLLKRFIQNNMLFGGGSTYTARASALKKIDIPAKVDMFTDEFLVLALLPLGKSYFIPETLSVWRGHGSNYSLNAKTKEVQIAKLKRLLSSSDALLDYLINNNFDKEVINIYNLKNLTRHISFKEFTGSKSMKDIIDYAKAVFLEIKPGNHLIKQYQVLNRLIPTGLFKLLKNIFKRNNNKNLQAV